MTLQRDSPSHQSRGSLTRYGIMTRRERQRSATERERMNLWDLLRRRLPSRTIRRMTLRTSWQFVRSDVEMLPSVPNDGEESDENSWYLVDLTTTLPALHLDWATGSQEQPLIKVWPPRPIYVWKVFERVSDNVSDTWEWMQMLLVGKTWIILVEVGG